MKILAFILFVFGSLGIRFLRWFAVVQQKEYRFDRLRLFMTTSEGKQELLLLFPKKTDFSLVGLKRPRLTPRMIVTIGITAVIILGVVEVLYLLTRGSSSLQQLTLSLLAILIVWLLIPAIVILAALPTLVVHLAITRMLLFLAARHLAKQNPQVIGITGSYGKTSTKMVLAHILSNKYTVFATPKSFNTLLSVSKSVLRGYQAQQIAIIEYSAYVTGEIATLARYFRPQTAIITGFAPQHVGLFGSREAIIKAKSELVAALKSEETVFWNGKSPEVEKIVEFGKGAKKLTIHKVIPEDTFDSFSLTPDGFLLIVHKGKNFTTRFVGLQYVEIVAMAFQVARSFGMAATDILTAVESFIPSSAFTRIRPSKRNSRIIDDGGTSNPQGFLQALQTLSHVQAKQKVLITPGIVDLGAESAAIHFELAQQARDIVDLVLFVGESGQTVFTSVLGEKIVLTDKEEIAVVLKGLNEDTTVLVEGKMPAWVQAYLE
jgi:UDP-N-acetylmuramoyl-tripeptide--D-alanyl-D-alanine ligase